jgi:hypothetical protein
MTSPGRHQIPDNDMDDDLASDEDVAAYEAGLARIEARLKREHPELFDESGELNTAEVMRVLRQHAGGKTTFTDSEFLDLFGWPDRSAR